MLERAQKAAFDERISLVSLLLAGLNTRFAAARRADAVTDACYQEMLSFKRTLNNADPAQDGFVPAAVFAAHTTSEPSTNNIRTCLLYTSRCV